MKIQGGCHPPIYSLVKKTSPIRVNPFRSEPQSREEGGLGTIMDSVIPSLFFALMTMDFAIVMELDVFYTVVAEIFLTSSQVCNNDVITRIC